MHHHCILAGLDLSANYHKQDPDKLSNVFKLVCVCAVTHDYINKSLFPDVQNSPYLTIKGIWICMTLFYIVLNCASQASLLRPIRCLFLLG